MKDEGAGAQAGLGPRKLGQRLLTGERLWLFLDYDGTLADFAPTPDTLIPDPDLVELLARLARFPELLRVVIMSGRRFNHIRELLPVPGILLAGTYGIEFQTWQGEQVRLLDYGRARPFLDQLKRIWEALIDGQKGFYLEDKGYSLAIHARFADEEQAGALLLQAGHSAEQEMMKHKWARKEVSVGEGTPARQEVARHEVARQEISGHEAAGQEAAGQEVAGAFHILGGDRFLEVAPEIANKGESVRTLLQRFAWPGAGIVYIGDDDKDEEAFKVVRALGGTAVLVTSGRPESLTRHSAAQYRLEDPSAVREWLSELAEALERGQAAA